MAKTCNSCNTNDMAVMPIAQHEKDQNRLMSIIKKQWIAIVLLVCLSFGSFGLFVWHKNQYEDVVETEETIIEGVTQETEGGDNNFVGGDYTNGEANN